MKMADHVKSLEYKRVAARAEASEKVSDNFKRLQRWEAVPLVMVRDMYHILSREISEIELREPVLASKSYGEYLEWLLGQRNIRELAGKLRAGQILLAMIYLLQGFGDEAGNESLGEVGEYLEDGVKARGRGVQSDFDLEKHLSEARVQRGRERAEMLSKYGLELLERYGAGELEDVCALADGCRILELPEVAQMWSYGDLLGERGEEHWQPGRLEQKGIGLAGYNGYQMHGQWEDLVAWQWCLPWPMLAYKLGQGRNAVLWSGGRIRRGERSALRGD